MTVLAEKMRCYVGPGELAQERGIERRPSAE
jgi:hypothetical protein